MKTKHAAGYLAAMSCIAVALALVMLSNESNALAQQQEQQFLSNRTAFDVMKPIKDLSFQIDNMTFSHHTASVNGIRMHYVIGGHGNPVVLLHGWPETWYEWRHVMPALAKNYTVIAPDLRGLGDSSKPTTGYDSDTTAKDIYQLVFSIATW
jgi:hypothetical protein